MTSRLPILLAIYSGIFAISICIAQEQGETSLPSLLQKVEAIRATIQKDKVFSTVTQWIDRQKTAYASIPEQYMAKVAAFQNTREQLASLRLSLLYLKYQISVNTMEEQRDRTLLKFFEQEPSRLSKSLKNIEEQLEAFDAKPVTHRLPPHEKMTPLHSTINWGKVLTDIRPRRGSRPSPERSEGEGPKAEPTEETKELDEEIARLRIRVARLENLNACYRAHQKTSCMLTGIVLANSDQIVTFSIGSAHGVTSGLLLSVQRENRCIAMIRVVEVYPDQSKAAILPRTLRTPVRASDTVFTVLPTKGEKR